MIAIIDYGVGNLFSLTSSLNSLSIENEVTGDINKIRKASKIILPGVGAFGDAIEKLAASGLIDEVINEAKEGKPLLGICLGMQMLFEKSYEYGEHNGLGLLKGQVVPFEGRLSGELRIPHMGWNSLCFDRDDDFFKYVKQGDYVYFVHSFFVENCQESRIAYCDYGIEVTAAVRKNNIFGTQFHPEKSGKVGLGLLKAFNEYGG